MKSFSYWTKLRERCEMSGKIGKIIEEALKDFRQLKTKKEQLNKARRFLEKWGVECENFRDVGINAPVLESLRLKMKGKICVSAPDWFRLCDPEDVPPTILYVPEKLALKILTLGCLPEPEDRVPGKKARRVVVH